MWPEQRNAGSSISRSVLLTKSKCTLPSQQIKPNPDPQYKLTLALLLSFFKLFHLGHICTVAEHLVVFLIMSTVSEIFFAYELWNEIHHLKINIS